MDDGLCVSPSSSLFYVSRKDRVPGANDVDSLVALYALLHFCSHVRSLLHRPIMGHRPGWLRSHQLFPHLPSVYGITEQSMALSLKSRAIEGAVL